MPGDLLGAYWKSMARGRDFRVQSVARVPREEAIALVEERVQRAGGFVLDVHMFSDLALAMIVELGAGDVAALVDGLAVLGWAVEVEPAREALASRAPGRLEGTVQVTFPDGEGRLVIPTPAVPG
jgi:hypothetical protein